MSNMNISTTSDKKRSVTKISAKPDTKKPAAPRTRKTAGTNSAASEPRPATPGSSRKTVTAEERARMIEEAAYYLAEQRGFSGGDPASDWLAAEAIIDQKIAQRK